MRHSLAIGAVVLAGILAGCGTQYVLKMTPDGDELRRSISGAAPNEGQPDAKGHTVAGRFVHSESNPVGGAGVFERLETPMGSVHIYAERFRGSHDVIDSLSLTLDAVDDLIQALDRWITWQMASQPGSEKLRAFIRDGLRKDLRNVVVYLWLGQNAGGDDEETIIRIAAYLHERGYFEVEDLPAIFRGAGAFDESDPAGEKDLFSLIQRFVATRMGVSPDEPIPSSLDFLSDVDSANESLEAHRRHQIATGELKPDADGDKDAKSDDHPQEPSAEVQAAAERVMNGLVLFSFGSDKLDATLAVKTEPVLTNGEWDAEAGQIVWSGFLPEDKQIPVFCSAVWAEPDAAFQELHFGKVALQGESLCEYVLWRKALTATQAREWDQFVAALRPDDALVSRLTEFRFSSDPPDDAAESDEAGPKRTSHAASVVGAILSTVTPEDQ